ncbi:MAG: histidine--tRNA ligase [Candidatus Dojkabacteria bacterium]
MGNKIQNVKGFRDFLPEEKRRRDYIAEKIKQSFDLFGFEPLETPVVEYKELLSGKYGEEADKLLYTFEDRGGRGLGLRYDQTVPTARVIAQYREQLPKYFRRYQIQDNFRAEKPQKGRYRQFTQCDIDIFNANSPLADAEILAATFAAYKNIGFKDIQLWINDRTVLIETVSEFETEQVDKFSIIQTIDKLDKKSEAEVVAELVKKRIEPARAEELMQKIRGTKASEKLSQIISYALELGIPENTFVFRAELARGLDYYTGMIFEIKSPSYPAGSLGGGGRYDNLLGNLMGVDIPAVGVAFGFDRTVEAAEELGLINLAQNTQKILVTVLGEETSKDSLQAAARLRNKGITCELFPDEGIKLSKQLKYANDAGFDFVVLIGEEEQNKGVVKLKNMASGKETEVQPQLLSDEFLEL